MDQENNKDLNSDKTRASSSTKRSHENVESDSQAESNISSEDTNSAMDNTTQSYLRWMAEGATNQPTETSNNNFNSGENSARHDAASSSTCTEDTEDSTESMISPNERDSTRACEINEPLKLMEEKKVNAPKRFKKDEETQSKTVAEVTGPSSSKILVPHPTPTESNDESIVKPVCQAEPNVSYVQTAKSSKINVDTKKITAKTEGTSQLLEASEDDLDPGKKDAKHSDVSKPLTCTEGMEESSKTFDSSAKSDSSPVYEHSNPMLDIGETEVNVPVKIFKDVEETQMETAVEEKIDSSSIKILISPPTPIKSNDGRKFESGHQSVANVSCDVSESDLDPSQKDAGHGDISKHSICSEDLENSSKTSDSSKDSSMTCESNDGLKSKIEKDEVSAAVKRIKRFKESSCKAVEGSIEILVSSSTEIKDENIIQSGYQAETSANYDQTEQESGKKDVHMTEITEKVEGTLMEASEGDLDTSKKAEHGDVAKHTILTENMEDSSKSPDSSNKSDSSMACENNEDLKSKVEIEVDAMMKTDKEFEEQQSKTTVGRFKVPSEQADMDIDEKAGERSSKMRSDATVAPSTQLSRSAAWKARHLSSSASSEDSISSSKTATSEESASSSSQGLSPGVSKLEITDSTAALGPEMARTDSLSPKRKIDDIDQLISKSKSINPKRLRTSDPDESKGTEVVMERQSDDESEEIKAPLQAAMNLEENEVMADVSEEEKENQPIPGPSLKRTQEDISMSEDDENPESDAKKKRKSE